MFHFFQRHRFAPLRLHQPFLYVLNKQQSLINASTGNSSGNLSSDSWTAALVIISAVFTKYAILPFLDAVQHPPDNIGPLHEIERGCHVLVVDNLLELLQKLDVGRQRIGHVGAVLVEDGCPHLG